MDVEGYLECLRECRARFPQLTIRSAVELGEPHWNPEAAAALLRRGEFDLVVAALHSLPSPEGGHVEVSDAYLERSAPDVLRAYLAETVQMIESWDQFDALAHIDYAVRSWPSDQGPHRTIDFEEEYRAVLEVLARKGRAMEITRLPLDPFLVTWWNEAGGHSVTFGSDVHDPRHLAQGFSEAVEMPISCGYGPHPVRSDIWNLRDL
jgi:histidinol-phosphatase (PHP family)